ncbi:MAG: asparagine synthase (glutamine-hydrolyzing) [Dethiobacter sp.]|nr:asparagine synthase (glutamine-hydrolyzing) [Dethiobacter sp.]MBS4024000.1 asparagine synthase (glutamine-hydrolyzing) [Dethiobacter sp.]
MANTTSTLSARGPDASGYWISKHAALGHCRLSVVDPAGGAQPMIRKVGKSSYIIIYNGELYNTPELRKELEQRGHTFSGHSDTEVLLASYIEWGKDCLPRLNGIFAFAVWDDLRQRLFLARDRLGVKPLFYTQRGSSFLFASELKALLANPLVKPVLDAEGLAEVFVMGPSRTPGHGIFKGVSELKPGCFIHADKRGVVQEKRYWSLESRAHEDDLETTIAKVRHLVEDSVKRQLVADVPVATFLSGGVDSTALTAIAASAFALDGRGTLHTYSIDYAENDRYFQQSLFQPNADAPWAKLASEKIGTIHHGILIDSAELAAALSDAVKARDLPGMADVDSSLLLFCREVKKDVTVVLSGECADEVFGGYPWFTHREEYTAETFPWIRNIDARMKLLSPETVFVLRPHEYLRERYQQALWEVPRLMGEDALEARMREMFYLNITRFMPTLLDRKDRMSMAVGLEARVPFCDHRLVEYVWNIPWSMKYYGGREKAVLRLALNGLVPEEVLNRKKSPYPKTHHPAYLAAVRERVLSILADSEAPLNRLIDYEAVRAFAASEEAAVKFPWFGQLMGGPQLLAFLTQVNSWLRDYKVSFDFDISRQKKMTV